MLAVLGEGVHACAVTVKCAAGVRAELAGRAPVRGRRSRTETCRRAPVRVLEGASVLVILRLSHVDSSGDPLNVSILSVLSLFLFQQIKKDLKKYSKIFEQKDRLSQSKASKVSPPGLREEPASGLGGTAACATDARCAAAVCRLVGPGTLLWGAGHPDVGDAGLVRLRGGRRRARVPIPVQEPL